MATRTSLDYRGMGPFLPYGALERMLRDAGTLRLRVDEGVSELVALWASRRGYYSAVQDGTVIVSVAPLELIETPRERKAAKREAAAKQAAAAAAVVKQLSVDKSGWRSDIAQKLTDIAFVIKTVLHSQILYRGPARGPAFNSTLSGKVLLRVSLSDQDYFIYVVNGKVLAAAQIGRALTPEQAESLLEQLKSPDVIVTVYDASKMFD